MLLVSVIKKIKNCVVTFLTVPHQHEDPYVNAILSVKVSKEEVEQTLNLLLVNPWVSAQERAPKYHRCVSTKCYSHWRTPFRR